MCVEVRGTPPFFFFLRVFHSLEPMKCRTLALQPERPRMHQSPSPCNSFVFRNWVSYCIPGWCGTEAVFELTAVMLPISGLLLWATTSAFSFPEFKFTWHVFVSLSLFTIIETSQEQGLCSAMWCISPTYSSELCDRDFVLFIGKYIYHLSSKSCVTDT